MMRTMVSVRGQTVIPRSIRDALGIKPNSQLEWHIRNGMILVVPIPEDPIRGAVGILKGRGPTTKDLLAERKADRDREP